MVDRPKTIVYWWLKSGPNWICFKIIVIRINVKRNWKNGFDQILQMKTKTVEPLWNGHPYCVTSWLLFAMISRTLRHKIRSRMCRHQTFSARFKNKILQLSTFVLTKKTDIALTKKCTGCKGLYFEGLFIYPVQLKALFFKILSQKTPIFQLNFLTKQIVYRIGRTFRIFLPCIFEVCHVRLLWCRFGFFLRDILW